jgi:2-C-methyl-D-erythritol 2,4-cyclodiphosphate synthase
MLERGFRIGHGFDAHPFESGRALRLGGVTVPYARGLKGHSDADVLLHAVANALLGAIAAGDLGRHFPPSDARYRGADSAALLTDVVARVRRAGYAVGNLDATVVAQVPQLAPFLTAMEERIAEILGARPGTINVKASSPEGLGTLGRGDGVVAWAVVLLEATGDDGAG